MLPNEGKHKAKLVGQIRLYTTQAGALCCAVPVELVMGGQSWSGKSTQTIIKSDGQINTISYDNMVNLFGDPMAENNPLYRWNGQDEVEIGEIEGGDKLFEIVGEYRDSEPDDEGNTHQFFSIKYINQIGGGFKMPDTLASRDEVLKKFGSKFRALAASAGKKSPAAKAKPESKVEDAPEPEAEEEKPAKKSLPGKKSLAAKETPAKSGKRKRSDPLFPTSTMEEVWGAMSEKFPDMADKQQQAWWYAILEEKFPGKDNDTMSVQDWGEFKDYVIPELDDANAPDA